MCDVIQSDIRDLEAKDLDGEPLVLDLGCGDWHTCLVRSLESRSMAKFGKLDATVKALDARLQRQERETEARLFNTDASVRSVEERLDSLIQRDLPTVDQEISSLLGQICSSPFQYVQALNAKQGLPLPTRVEKDGAFSFPDQQRTNVIEELNRRAIAGLEETMKTLTASVGTMKRQLDACDMAVGTLLRRRDPCRWEDQTGRSDETGDLISWSDSRRTHVEEVDEGRTNFRRVEEPFEEIGRAAFRPARHVDGEEMKRASFRPPRLESDEFARREELLISGEESEDEVVRQTEQDGRAISPRVTTLEAGPSEYSSRLDELQTRLRSSGQEVCSVGPVSLVLAQRLKELDAKLAHAGTSRQVAEIFSVEPGLEDEILRANVSIPSLYSASFNSFIGVESLKDTHI